ncbi:MAG: cytidylate kinase family protein [Candidatus Levybacteria bacterium]|nr:cytidylate kinase family protein [Candidatus Levybacteria bacterium]
MLNKPIEIPGVRIVTISGRIGAGSTSLAKSLSKLFGWKHLEGGEIFWEAVRKKMGLDPKDTDLRPDEEDMLFDEQLKKILREDSDVILETKLAGFNAQNIDGVFKILVVCEDRNGVDQAAIRIDRLVNREHVSVDEAKQEVVEREKNDLEKWRKMYAAGNTEWVYYNPSYYDLVINTFDHNPEESVKLALSALNISA